MLNKTNEKAIGCTYVKTDEVISVGSTKKKWVRNGCKQYNKWKRVLYARDSRKIEILQKRAKQEMRAESV